MWNSAKWGSVRGNSSAKRNPVPEPDSRWRRILVIIRGPQNTGSRFLCYNIFPSNDRSEHVGQEEYRVRSSWVQAKERSIEPEGPTSTTYPFALPE